MNTEKALADSLGIPYKIKKIKIGKYLINYFEAGPPAGEAGAGKPLVLIHGGNIGWGQWYPNIPELSKHFKIYAIDMPGAGRSSKLDYAKLSFEKDYFEILSKFLQKLNLKKPDVIGSSVGAWAAIKVAIKRGGINRLVAVNPVGFSNFADLQGKMISHYWFAKFLTKTAYRPRDHKSIEKFLRSVFYNKNLELSQEFVEYFFETTETSHNLLFISKITSSLKPLLLLSDLPKLSNRILIMWGDRDKFLPLVESQKNFGLLKNSKISIFNSAGHIVNIEKGKEFNKVVLDFLL